MKFNPNNLKHSICVVLILFIAWGCAGTGSHPRELKIISQKAWGGTPVTDSISSQRIERITIHHGGVYFDPKEDVEEYLVNLQKWSRSEKDWIDIPYHYMMDMQGRLYEGRSVMYPGDTNTDYNPAGHLLICAIGNYEEQEFSDVQYSALVNWLKYFCQNYHVAADSIRGHKDYTETLCPGENMYKYLRNGSLIGDVKGALNKI